MINFKTTLFTKIIVIVTATLVTCFVFAASAMVFDNPECNEAAKKTIMIVAGAGLFFVILVIALRVFAEIGMFIVEAWKKLTSDDVLDDE